MQVCNEIYFVWTIFNFDIPMLIAIRCQLSWQSDTKPDLSVNSIKAPHARGKNGGIPENDKGKEFFQKKNLLTFTILFHSHLFKRYFLHRNFQCERIRLR